MSFAYKASITVAHAKVPNTDQTDFPILVSGTYDGTGGLPNLKTVGNSGHVQNDSGYDIYFYSDSSLTTRIPAERESYNASTGVIVYWVKKTVATASDTVIYIAYGDSGISTDPNSDGTYGATSVWDTNYQSVWHFKTSLGLTDSTSNAYTLTNSSPGFTAITGQIDGAATSTGTSHYYLNRTSAANLLNLNTLTFSAWVNPNDWTNPAGGGQMDIINTTNRSLYIKNTGVLDADLGTSNSYRRSISTNTVSKSAWSYVVATIETGTNKWKIYLNGSEVSYSNQSAGTGTPSTDTGGVMVGAYYLNSYSYNWNGGLDEVRVSSINRSADWISTEYNNQFDPASFFTMGSETAVGGASGPANLKTYNTNAKANIKTINTNAIANVKSLDTNV